MKSTFHFCFSRSQSTLALVKNIFFFEKIFKIKKIFFLHFFCPVGLKLKNEKYFSFLKLFYLFFSIFFNFFFVVVCRMITHFCTESVALRR